MSHHDFNSYFSENENCEAIKIIPTNGESYRNRNMIFFFTISCSPNLLEDYFIEPVLMNPYKVYGEVFFACTLPTL